MAYRDAVTGQPKGRAAPLPFEARLARAERLARSLDRAFRLPGTQIRFGWDGIIGLVPGIGDTLTMLPAAWILSEAWSMGLPRHVIARMAWNVGIDWLVGLVPFVGDLFDIGWKANLRNVALMRAELEKRRAL